jgi:hypothetical protein
MHTVVLFEKFPGSRACLGLNYGLDGNTRVAPEIGALHDERVGIREVACRRFGLKRDLVPEI